MNTADRYLMNTIDANTRSGGRSRKGSGWGGTLFVLAITLAASGVLLWADRAFI